MGDLDRYQDKRDFEKTPEPEGAEAAVADASCEVRGEDAPCGPGLAYVIQKHAASRLHYDVRLEMHGTLVSWAVPKGPSFDPSQKRLAVHVEDHPIEYGSFEGTIPKGEYGGGTVMVWDRGTWEPLGDMDEEFAEGRLKFELHGEKLQGRWTLIRMKPKENERAENWLLIKERDEYVRPADEYDVLAARPESAASGRDMEQIAAGDAPSPPAAARTPSEGAADHPATATKGPLPADAPLQLATLVEIPPEGEEWIHEIKYDGYRLRCAIENGSAKLLTRNAKDWTDRFPELAAAASALPVGSALLDGEVVVFGPSGVPDFGSLQHAISRKDTKRTAYMAFDLLYLNGWDLLGVPLLQRKGLLKTLVDGAGNTPIRFTDHVGGHGSRFHREACTLSLEGSVSKKAEAPYRPGRTREWQKVKCLKRQEFVVGGYTEARGSRHGFGALLIGVRESDGLRFAGRVGTGFTDHDLDAMSEQLAAISAEESPFITEPTVPDRALHWVAPEMVVEVSFQEWTEEGVVRHSSFLGVREDIEAAEVRRESAARTANEPDPGGSDNTPSKSASASGVRITNPGKVLYPEIGLTKGSLVTYYESVAEAMLPHVARRPLTLVRCPHGREGECFFQKHPESKGWPSQVGTVEIADKGGPARYSYVEDVSGLVSLVQLGALEIHAWNSLVDSPESPDRIVFDLDPGPGVTWETVVSSGELIRDTLAALGFTGFAKTTGGKGLHVVTPIAPELSHDEVRAFSRGFVDRLAAHDPAAFTAKMAKEARSGRVFIDYLRNAHGATAVCAFSTRARPGAPVSVPVAWQELGTIGDPATFDTTTTPERLARLTEDPWAGYEDARTNVTSAHFAALGVPFQEHLSE